MTITESAPLVMESEASKPSRIGSMLGGIQQQYSKHRKVVLIALSVLLIGLITAVAVLGVRIHSDGAIDDAKTGALAAANDNVVKLLSYRFDTVDADLGAAAQLLTGDFAGEFSTLATQTIIPAAKEAGTVTTATVAASALVDASADAVTVLLFLNQSTTSKESPNPKLDSSRVRVELVSVGDKWLISSLVPV